MPRRESMQTNTEYTTIDHRAGRLAHAAAERGQREKFATLSRRELRRIVADLIG